MQDSGNAVVHRAVRQTAHLSLRELHRALHIDVVVERDAHVYRIDGLRAAQHWWCRIGRHHGVDLRERIVRRTETDHVEWALTRIDGLRVIMTAVAVLVG